MFNQKKPSIRNARLQSISGVSVLALLLGAPAFAQNCDLSGGQLVEDCSHTNAGTVVAMPTQPNVELEDISDLSTDGFEISIDGAPVAQSGEIIENGPSVAARKRRQDLALAADRISVKFDGLDIQPRLVANLEFGGRAPAPGDIVTINNRMNYPAYVARGEIRIIERHASGEHRTIEVIPLSPNNATQIRVPEGNDLTYVYRVYDSAGRTDQTNPVSLRQETLGAGLPELGVDNTYRRNIPVNGGAVTVSGQGLGANITVRTLDGTTRTDGQGNFVLQRILPTGDYQIGVDVAGGPSLTRDLEVPATDLFYIGALDVTLDQSLSDEGQDASPITYDKTIVRGRVAFYLKGRIRGGYLLTAAADTTEEELGDILRNFDEKDPRSLLDRIDPDEYYPVYGDDSTSEQDAPTSGRLFVRIEKDRSHAMWGNFRSELAGTELLRTNRTLYGAQGVYRSQRTTTRGEAALEAELSSAQPGTVPERDVFLGTGGSTYFLRNQDISIGSEIIEIETRDKTTDRVLARRTLVYGVDYEINYLQGLIILKTPLSASASSGNVVTNSGSGSSAYLVASYEHTPGAADLDAFAHNVRVQGWVTDRVRIGATVRDEDQGTNSQSALGLDLRYQHSEQSYLEAEVARTTGTGDSSELSVDGGLTFTTQNGAVGTGNAVRLKGHLDLADVGSEREGYVTGYFEERKAGFSTLNHKVTNDEVLWGAEVQTQISESSSLTAHIDSFDEAGGRNSLVAGGEVKVAVTENLDVTVGVEAVDKTTPGDAAKTGSRVDVAAKAELTQSEDESVYIYGQATVDNSGGLKRNDRIGVGGTRQLNRNWSVSGEVSYGTSGPGGRALMSYKRDDNNELYFGYALNPDRDFGGIKLNGDDLGSFVFGARRELNDRLSVYGENTYDLFGEHRALTSVYGVEYAATDALSLTGQFEFGQVQDPIVNTDVERMAFSLNSSYQTEKTTLDGTLEYRIDEGLSAGTSQDAETIAARMTFKYKFDEERRLLMHLEGVHSTSDVATTPDAKFAEASIGYAYRPIEDDRLNILAKYSYLYDMTERSSSAAASGANFTTPRQIAHVFAVDASYDVNEHWTIGGKVGGRLSKQDSGSGFVSNNAVIGVVNARFHVTHNWDGLVELRQLHAEDIGTDTGLLVAVSRHMGNNVKLTAGYNFGSFSDDLRDVTYDNSGLFLNLLAKF